MARYSSLRASDAERDAVAERLRKAAVEGRLEPDELEERLHAALRARTHGDLQRLLTDLPAEPAPWERRRYDVVPTGRLALVVAVRMLVALAVLAGALVVLAMTAAWWVLAALVWLTIRTTRGSCRGRGAGWHRPARARRV